MEAKRDERREKSQSLNKIDEFEFIDTLCSEKKATSVFDLLRKLSKQEFKVLYGTLGSSYKEKLKAIMVFNNTQKRNMYKGKPFEFILEKNASQPSEHRNVQWLEYMFRENRINIPEFLAWTKLVAEEKLNKINTLILQGPTGTGKSLTLNCLIGKLNTGIVTRCGDQNQFHFQNLLNKSYALFEESRISEQTVDDYKFLLEGVDFEVNVKHSDPEVLQRIPIFTSTNKPIDYWVPPADGDALYSRTKTFTLHKEIKGFSDRHSNQYGLNPPPGRITSSDFLALFEKYKKEISDIIKQHE